MLDFASATREGKERNILLYLAIVSCRTPILAVEADENGVNPAPPNPGGTSLEEAS